MHILVAQVVADSESSSPPLALPSALVGLVLAITGLVLVMVNRRRTPPGEQPDRNWMYFAGGAGLAAGLAMIAYGLLGLGS